MFFNHELGLRNGQLKTALYRFINGSNYSGKGIHHSRHREHGEIKYTLPEYTNKY